jgi:hypothetical protein
VFDVSAVFFRYEYPLAAAQLAFAMIGMGATLTVEDLLKVLRVPRGFAVGLAVQLLLIPALALGVSTAFALSAGLAAGLVLVAAVPGGSMSNVFTYFARGNIALSILSAWGAARRHDRYRFRPCCPCGSETSHRRCRSCSPRWPGSPTRRSARCAETSAPI